MDNEIDLYYKLVGVMHSVDKWLEGDELKQDEVNRAATMRGKTLQIIERLEEENTRLRAQQERENETVCTLQGHCSYQQCGRPLPAPPERP